MKRYSYKTYLCFLYFVFVVLFLSNCSPLAVGVEYSIKTFDFGKDIPCEWLGVERIVAIGDLHGAYDHFVEILIGTKLVDDKDKLNWIGGKTHLVQIGDVLDRGDNPKEIFNLAIKLEKQAEAAGGKVHMMIGNHEEMNLANTAFDRKGYVTVEQFKQFFPDKLRLKQENKFRRRAGSRSSEKSTSNGDFVEEWEEMIDKFIGAPRASDRISYLRNLSEMYGDWILGHNVVIKINDIVFVHGGISEWFSEKTLKWINETFRKELDDIRTAIIRELAPKIPSYDRELYNLGEGPLWYRALASEESEEFYDDVVRILGNLQAGHIIIAHTPQIGKEKMSKYDDKVWIIDTGIANYYRAIGGHISALIIDNGQFSPWYPDSEKKDSNKTSK